jgi:hypothetical protein
MSLQTYEGKQRHRQETMAENCLAIPLKLCSGSVNCAYARMVSVIVVWQGEDEL